MMILDSTRYTKDGSIFFTKTEKVWGFLTDSDHIWRTSTNPWPKEEHFAKKDLKTLGPTYLVVWDE